MRKGFTILELLIVIMVIAILVGIALPRIRGIREEGYITQAKGELRTLQIALESYSIHNSSAYPAEANFPSDLEDAKPNIIGDTAPTDPFNSGTDYGYDLSANGNHYVIYSVGPDGDGSAVIDDNGDITETNGDSCIYVSSSERDTTP